MDNGEMETKNTSYTLKVSSETLLPIQLFEFRAHLLEAVEELRMGRLANAQYEEQISKILMEKQELMWKNESLSNQEEILEKGHKDALAIVKKQLQAKMCAMEEEKGRYQLAAETKERETLGLREDIKALQISKYNLQKKVQEMEQKLQLHILAKEDHAKQLGECEKCFGNVTQQFGMIKEVHEKIEQNVQVAIQNNKKLKSAINQKKVEIDHLKEELNTLSSDFMNYKVTHGLRAGEEKFSLFEKEQQLKEMEERLQTETEINRRIMEENLAMKEEKQDNMRTLSNMLTLVQRHNQTIISVENQLSALKEDYKTLERDNELQRAKATENEEKFLALQSEHEKAFRTWTEQVQEHQQADNMDITECDSEHSPSGNKIQNDPLVHTTSSNLDGCNAVSLPGSEIQRRDESKLESDSKDVNSLPNVYKITDKSHLSEGQEDECSLIKNKDNFATVKQSVEGCCDGKCTEELPADTACLNDVDEYYERAAEGSTMQTQVTVESVKKMWLDNNTPLTVFSEDASQQTDSSNRKSGDGTSEVVYIAIDKEDITENSKGVLVNEIPTQESKLFPKTTEQMINGQRADRDDSTARSSHTRTVGDGSSYQSSGSNWGTSNLQTTSCLNDQSRQSKTDSMQQTKESPGGDCVESPLCKQIGRDDQKSFVFEKNKIDYEDMSSNFDVRFNNTQIGETESKSLGQEGHSIASVLTYPSSSCQVPMKSVSLPSPVDPKHENQSSQSLQNTENTGTLKGNKLDLGDSCPPESEEHAIMVKSSTSDGKRELHADEHIEQMTQQIGDQEYVGKGNACIQDDSNMALSCTDQGDSGKPQVGTSCTKPDRLPEEKPKPQNEGAIDTCSNLAKLFSLPRANPWNRQSVNISFRKQSNCTFPKLPSQDECTAAEYGSTTKRRAFDTLSTNIYPVPRKDHSAEWNAIQQTFHKSSFPTDHSDMMEKLDGCPVIIDFHSSTDVTNAQTKPQPEAPCGNENNCPVSSIQCQISAIEKFLIDHRLNGPKRRKLEDCVQAEQPKTDHML
ncbi:coiled-coil domain-containing protein 73 [Mixophyes fleayi]|uniref:coiled-coil domain-containing protein 73 n=1 Tax=Mixophyes fleayi TaxID=3061075 RepID=UPI003F4E0771